MASSGFQHRRAPLSGSARPTYDIRPGCGPPRASAEDRPTIAWPIARRPRPRTIPFGTTDPVAVRLRLPTSSERSARNTDSRLRLASSSVSGRAQVGALSQQHHRALRCVRRAGDRAPASPCCPRSSLSVFRGQACSAAVVLILEPAGVNLDRGRRVAGSAWALQASATGSCVFPLSDIRGAFSPRTPPELSAANLET